MYLFIFWVKEKMQVRLIYSKKFGVIAVWFVMKKIYIYIYTQNLCLILFYFSEIGYKKSHLAWVKWFMIKLVLFLGLSRSCVYSQVITVAHFG